MTEYIIILAVVALAAVVAVGYFGDTVQAQFAAMGQELVGGNANGALTDGRAAANDAEATIANTETLTSYAE